MYCGSCLRDNALAGALLKLGHKVTLIPLYTTLRTDTAAAPTSDVFYGGINVYLQHASKLFRVTPRIFDWLFDRPWLLKMAGSMGAGASPAKLAPLTRDILLGYNGPTQKELRRLITFLADEIKPDIITLPNLMFIGMAQSFRDKLGCPVICELTGEDIFLDAMLPVDRENIRNIIQAATPHVSRFVATSNYYADKLANYLGLPRERVLAIYPGLPDEILHTPGYTQRDPAKPQLTISYLARICPEKGIDQLIEAFFHLRDLPGGTNFRLDYAGYLGPQYKAWHRILSERIASAGLSDSIRYRGEVDLAGKLDVLDRSDLFCVPTQYPEAKGIFVLEAMARGLPVVAPEHGSFPEFAALTGAVQLTPPNDPVALAKTLHQLLNDRPRFSALAAAARPAVLQRFVAERMAVEIAALCEDALAKPA